MFLNDIFKGYIGRLDAIRAIKPFAVLVEEASEVLEPILFSALTESTVKLEMIGDHLQLQPSVQQKFDFQRFNHVDISLFERLILGSSTPRSVLAIQRRMRKNICDITRGYYKEIVQIEDHSICSKKRIGQQSVVEVSSKLPREVPGLCSSIYFWHHTGRQTKATVGLSKVNDAEAQMVCSLAQYLVDCGVPKSSIAILTPYKGQLMSIRASLLKLNLIVQRTKPAHGARFVPPPEPDQCILSTVDRFQGDEADIVILSLVIDAVSNTPFVRLVNRMIVALSRPRLGDIHIFSQHQFVH